jgi:cation diffusion facilitator family transporter
MYHSHIFDEGNPLGERKTRWAVLLTVVMMVVEIAGGWFFNSMALLADGWHMSSHALALGLSVIAYKAARHFAGDERFSFGTWKIEVLGGYTSAIFLVMIAFLMFFQSFERLFFPTPIHYSQAIVLAAAGLGVNLLCAWLLKDGHTQGHHLHDHVHDHAHEPEEKHHDLNLRSAYIHVLSDAATSVLAIVALIGGKYWGASWLDPLMGIAGAFLVIAWATGLLRESGRILLDAEMDSPVVAEIREVFQSGEINAQLTDLHVWRVGKGKYSCIVSLAASGSTTPGQVKRMLSIHQELVHITVEIQNVLN